MRKHWLDNLRWVTVLLVLLYHVFYFYNNKGVFGGIGGFGGRQPQDAVMYILYPWIMILLFLVAGISSRYYLENHTGREFFRARTLKLLVPSTVGLLVFQWMTGYFNTQIAAHVQETTLLPEGIPAVGKYLAWCVSGIGPLWFIQDLWVFSLILLLVRRLDRNDKCYNACGKMDIWVLILLVIPVYLAAFTLIRDPRPESADGLYNLYKPVYYLIPFLLGYFVFSHEEIQDTLSQIALVYLIPAAFGCGLSLVLRSFGKDNSSPQYLLNPVNAFYAWLMVLALIGSFKKWFDKTSPFATWMTRSSFGIYVVHYLVIASLGYMMKVYTAIPPFAQYLILGLAVFTLSPALYELIRRIPVLRWCVLGISRKQ